MKKNLIIGILLVFSASSMTYAVYQQTIANRLRVMAEFSAVEAKKQQEMATIAKNDAIRMKVLAEEQRKAAEEAYRRLTEELAKSKK